MEEDSHFYNHEFAAKIYDLNLQSDKPEWFRNRNSFILNLSESYGKNVLNLGCGTGELAIFLGHNGCKVKGVDLSEYMIDVARKKAKTEQVSVQNNITFEQGDMKSFSFPEKFQIITISGGVFMHLLLQEEQIKCLNTIYTHLEEGGILCLDNFWPRMELMVEHSDPNNVRRIPRKHIEGTHGNKLEKYDELFYDLPTQQLNGRSIYIEFGQAEQFVAEHNMPLNIRTTFPTEMRLLFQLCGFTIISENWGYTNKPIDYGCTIVWVVQKKGLKKEKFISLI